MLGLQKDQVKVVRYTKKWAKLYKEEEERLESILKKFQFEIEHVGSTAIPGLSAKPIIDIAIAVDTIELVKEVGQTLSLYGYDLLDEIDTKGQILARKGTDKCRTHYIHIVTLMSDRWINTNLFKRYLLEHPQTVKDYEKLKKQLAKQYKNERTTYTANKNDFIQGVLKLAYKQYRGYDPDEE